MKRSVEREMARYYFGIKVTSKLARTHQSIGNSLIMLLEKEKVSRKESGKLLFWNKNNINLLKHINQ